MYFVSGCGVDACVISDEAWESYKSYDEGNMIIYSFEAAMKSLVSMGRCKNIPFPGIVNAGLGSRWAILF